VNWDLKRYGLAVGCSALLAVAMHQPAQAAQTEITGVQLTPAAQGFELILKIQGNSRPPVFTVNRGNASVADINNTQLRLPSGQTFTQANPAAGISGVGIRQLDAKTVRITVQGVQAAPISETVRSDGRQGFLVLRFNLAPALEATATGNSTPSTGSYPSAVPPSLRRASAPPVGDIAVGSLNVASDIINLNSTQVIPKLLLRNAPVREVLTLLGRASGVNVAFAEGEGSGDAAAAASGPTISLDIENESVQDVFNYVLRLSGLDANKVGNTVFVGKTLPGDAQNRIVRTLRLNQLRSTGGTKITNSLKTQSEIGGSIDPGSSGGSGGSTSASTSASTTTRSTGTDETFEEKGAKELLEAYGANGGGGGAQGGTSANLLQGLEVVADARTNVVTLIGTPRKVEIAAGILQQLDIRRRQAAVNVKIVDIDLLKTKQLGTNFQYNVNNALGFAFGPNGQNGPSGLGVVLGGAVSPVSTAVSAITNQVIGSIFASVQNNDVKVLTNPTLVVQEGSSAQVNLTQEIFSGTITTQSSTGTASGAGLASSSSQPLIRQVGVIFNVTVDRIDDNGFVTLNMAPEVSSPGSQFTTGGTTGTLINQRRMETGRIRLRDGQTLVLTGIIQDSDTRTVSKIPVLGDIPLIGQLFRRNTGSKERRELVVLVTPRVMDDSQQSSTGYQYSPGSDAQQLLNK
jgi:type IV pilus assembly protein PilQ